MISVTRALQRRPRNKKLSITFINAITLKITVFLPTSSSHDFFYVHLSTVSAVDRFWQSEGQ